MATDRVKSEKLMKIATYNVWNEDKGIGGRFEQLVHEIVCVDADIIALQEVTAKFYHNIRKQETGYQYCIFNKYIDEDEGLAILSKCPVDDCTFLHEHPEYANSKAQNILFRYGTSRFSLLMYIYHGILQEKKRNRLLLLTNISKIKKNRQIISCY